MKPLASHVTTDAPDRGGDFSPTRTLDDWMIRPRGSFGRSADRWQMMRTGLFLLMAGLILEVASSVLRVPLGLGGATRVAVLALAGLELLSGLVMLVGIGLCCSIPHEAGAGGWVVGILLSFVGSVIAVFGLISFVSLTALSPMGRPGLTGWLAMAILLLLAAGASFAASLSLTMIFRAAAFYWDDQSLGKSFVTYFILSWAMGAIYVAIVALLVGLVAVAQGKPGPDNIIRILVPTSCVLLVCSIALLIWFLVLVNRLRQLIPSAPGQGSSDRDD
jgi:hypothetical protein